MPRRPADAERTRRVLLVCGAPALVIAALTLWDLLGSVLFGEAASGAAGTPAQGLFVAPTLAAVVACVRLAGDDGSGHWCAECVARKPAGACSPPRCGALVG